MKKAAKILGILGAGAACALTGGLAAPAVGAALGTAMGLSGAAATSAGLAALGGGALAAGGAGMAGGTALIEAVAAGVGMLGASIAADKLTISELSDRCSKLEKENEQLRSALREANIDSAKKQKIIKKLNDRINELEKSLAKERAKNDSNYERIRLLEKMINDLEYTRSCA